MFGFIVSSNAPICNNNNNNNNNNTLFSVLHEQSDDQIIIIIIIRDLEWWSSPWVQEEKYQVKESL
jgi:hypothetical protein